jgi:uncharacterized repeat protein (TIGR04076 family)
MTDARAADAFDLWDLEVETVAGSASMVCDHPPGLAFRVEGEAIVMGPQGRFPMYALAALLPLLPAKQRPTDPNDWMSTDAEVACPDPHCGARFRIRRTARRSFRHAETTGLPEHRGTPYWQKQT